MLTTSTRNRLLAICQDVKAKKTVSEANLTWAQKNAIHDEDAAKLLKAAGKYIEGADQEDTTEI
jgi:predicted CoA-binding protein